MSNNSENKPVLVKADKIKYFTDGDNNKFVVEGACEQGLYVNQRNRGAGQGVHKSYVMSYDDILEEFRVDNVKFFPTESVTDLDNLFLLIGQFKKNAKAARLDQEDRDRKAKAEQDERDRIEKEKRDAQELEDRRRKAKALSLTVDLDDDDEEN